MTTNYASFSKLQEIVIFSVLSDSIFFRLPYTGTGHVKKIEVSKFRDPWRPPCVFMVRMTSFGFHSSEFSIAIRTYYVWNADGKFMWFSPHSVLSWRSLCKCYRLSCTLCSGQRTLVVLFLHGLLALCFSLIVNFYVLWNGSNLNLI